MQAVILAGGLGTRLGPLTAEVPKPMVRVKGKPFLEWQLNYLKSQGFKKFLLLTGYRAEFIQAYFGDGEKFGLNISYSVEQNPLGTGGALLQARPKLDREFALMFGDSFLPVNFSVIIQYFRQNNCEILMTVYDNQEDTEVPFNVAMDLKGKVQAYYKAGQSSGEKPKHLHFVEAGVYFVKKSALEGLDVGFCSFEADLLQPAIQKGRVQGWLSPRRFFDIGTPERLTLFERRMGDYF